MRQFRLVPALRSYVQGAKRSASLQNQSLQLLTSKDKSLSNDVRKFKPASKRFLLEGSFYTIQEYFDQN
jgi:hypothetical protein